VNKAFHVAAILLAFPRRAGTNNAPADGLATGRLGSRGANGRTIPIREPSVE